MKRKLLLLVVLVLAVGATQFLPQQTRDRLRTFLDVSLSEPSSEDQYRLVQATDSARARMELQKRAIQLTSEHLLLGIGPLNFEDAVDKMVREKEGVRSGWQVSHNSYLQVSSETGVPGLIFYGWTIFLCLKLNYKSFRACVREPELRTAALQSFGLWLATITYAVGVLFCSIAFDYYLAIIVAFTAAHHLALESARDTKPVAKAAPPIPEKRRPMPLKPAMR